MLFCKNLLFVHVPKAAGSALTEYLLGILPRPVWQSSPQGRAMTAASGVEWIPWCGHLTLAQADSISRTHGFGLGEFPIVLAVLRNPYDMEASYYAYQFSLPSSYMELTAMGQRSRMLARTEDFERYAILRSFAQGPANRIEDYYLVKGQLPPNLRLIRLESLDEDLPSALREAGIEPRGLVPRLNASQRNDWAEYYTRAAEQAVYRRYKWVFDHGFYERVDPATFPFVAEAPFNGERIPLEGLARQVGPAATWWPADGWVGEELRVRLAFDAPPSSVAIEGWRPPHLDGPLRLEFAVEERIEAASFHPGPFRLEVPYRVPRGSEAEIILTSSRTWSPIKNGWNSDERLLSVVLERVVVNAAPDDG